MEEEREKKHMAMKRYLRYNERYYFYFYFYFLYFILWL